MCLVYCRSESLTPRDASGECRLRPDVGLRERALLVISRSRLSGHLQHFLGYAEAPLSAPPLWLGANVLRSHKVLIMRHVRV